MKCFEAEEYSVNKWQGLSGIVHAVQEASMELGKQTIVKTRVVIVLIYSVLDYIL